MAEIWEFHHYVRMAKKRGAPGHFIRQWRKANKLTIERLAEMINLDHSTLSKIERGKTNYTQQTLEALADALGTTPWRLIQRDPSKKGSIWDILEQIPVSERENAAKALEGFTKKTGTG